MPRLLALALSVCLALAHAEDDVIVVDINNFDSVVSQGDIVVEFYAPWCGHCKKLAPEYEKAAKLLKEKSSNVRLAKCDVDDKDNKPLAEKYGVRGFPTIRLFRNGSLSNPEDYGGPRTAEGIVEEVTKAFGPPSFLISSEADAMAIARNELILVGAFGKEGEESNIFLEAAEKLRPQKIAIAHTFNPKLLEPCTADPEYCTGALVFMMKSLDKDLSKYGGPFEAEALREWAITESEPRLAELLQSSPRHMKKFQATFAKPEPRLIAYATKDYLELPALKEILIEVDGQDESFNSLFIDASMNSKAARFFGLDEGDYPAMVLHDHGKGVKYVQTKISPGDIKPFIAKWKEGKLEPTIKSEDPPKDDSGPVKVLVGKTFNDVVTGGKDVMVEFYAPWCGHCKKLAPVYDNLGKHFKDNDNVIIAKMDATANDIPDGRLQVKGFPTLKYLKKGGEVLDYAGDRSLEDLIKFVNDALGLGGGKETKEAPPEVDKKEEL